jgi:hypothetical protein
MAISWIVDPKNPFDIRVGCYSRYNIYCHCSSRGSVKFQFLRFVIHFDTTELDLRILVV